VPVQYFYCFIVVHRFNNVWNSLYAENRPRILKENRAGVFKKVIKLLFKTGLIKSITVYLLMGSRHQKKMQAFRILNRLIYKTTGKIKPPANLNLLQNSTSNENGYVMKVSMNLLNAICRAQVHTKLVLVELQT
jgi:hypothetical protein